MTTADPKSQTPIRVFDSVKALAFIGDLSMGQPTDHSLRTGWIAARLAQAAGLNADENATVREASLLRWSGCTGNAAGFAEVFGDDIAIRAKMVENRPGWIEPLGALGGPAAVLMPLARIHCEVSGEVARLLGLAGPTENTLRHIFEAWDGSGTPHGVARDAVPMSVYVVALAGDLEAFSRVYGVERAIALIKQRADARYPAHLVDIAVSNAPAWLQEIEKMRDVDFDRALSTPAMQQASSAELIADVVDLKLPWMTGFSRRVAATAAACCERLALDEAAQSRVYRAGLLHGIGRAAVPNSIWNQDTSLPASAWEKVRLVPYWTARAGKQTGVLAQATELASYAYERLDGSGYFRGLSGAALTLEARVLAASVAWVALRSRRPWRAELPADEAAQQLRNEVANGRLCSEAVNALLAEGQAFARSPIIPVKAAQHNVHLTVREIEVLRAISLGSSNKEAARELTLSPSTVRTHVESIFRKLECSTRAAATLKASAMGLL
ncbi:HD domain-containing phosphohydrolase [Paraburkholderia tropica]|uniref:HD domain-containing phosphohydrolase n=1 Tax=Paraburkholderia tropica TaxID=92647 RepID=UPI002AB5F93F|nr:HD domain-containing phosphohydrolase [Paraburkholderia tropica]